MPRGLRRRDKGLPSSLLLILVYLDHLEGHIEACTVLLEAILAALELLSYEDELVTLVGVFLLALGHTNGVDLVVELLQFLLVEDLELDFFVEVCHYYFSISQFIIVKLSRL